MAPNKSLDASGGSVKSKDEGGGMNNRAAASTQTLGGCNLEVFIEMIYALVHYPNIDTQRINQFRKKYDPQVDLIEPHITLMFPVPESIGENNLINHLEGVLSSQQPFPLHLQGFQKSWDDYLFLLVQEGNADIIALHSEIYTEVLADCWKADTPYVPHLTLGRFAENANEYAEALEEAKRLELDYRCVLDKAHLVKVNDTQIAWSKELSMLK